MTESLLSFVNILILIVVYSVSSLTGSHHNNTSVSCVNGATHVIGNVPDPHICSHYYSCNPDASTGYKTHTTPQKLNCSSINNETTLLYDFRHCVCVESEDGCYDAVKDHEDVFICTEPYEGFKPKNNTEHDANHLTSVVRTGSTGNTSSVDSTSSTDNIPSSTKKPHPHAT